MLADLTYRLRALFRKRSVEQELDEEIRFHVEHEIQTLISRGVPPDEAARRARLAFGGVEQMKDNCRDARGVSPLENAIRDVRCAVRMLVKTPGFTSVAVLTLALGIGANTAIFSAVKGILLRPLPYRDATQLVMLWEENTVHGWKHNIVSAANFNDWKSRNHAFLDMAPFVSRTYTLTGDGEPIEITGEQVTPNLFSLLGVTPLLGRAFTEEEGQSGGPRTVLLGYGLWQARFGGEPDIVGRHIAINGESYTVIGILPAGFDGCEACIGDHQPQIWTTGLDTHPTGRTNHSLKVVARLKPGITEERAQTEMTSIAEAIGREDPANSGWTVKVAGVRDDSVRVVAPAIMVLLGAVILILLVTCVNLANILLARGVSRQREIAVRTAMGASRGRVITQLLTENALLALIGGGLGGVIAFVATWFLRAFAPAEVTPGLANVGLSLPVLAYGIGLAMLTLLLFGLAPALLAARQDLNCALKQSGRGTAGSSGNAARGFLVSAEFALAMILVIGAALMISSFARISRVPLGFDASNVITMRVPLRGSAYKTNDRVAALFEKLIAQAGTLRGVENVSVSRGLPVDGWAGMDFVTEENPTPAPGAEPDANYLVVSPQYFRLMRIPLLQGRALSESDAHNTAPVAIVNAELVRELWSGGNPLGRRISIGTGAKHGAWLSVVGVAGDVMTQGRASSAHPEIYVPLAQYPWTLLPRHLLVRTAPGADLAPIIAGIRRELARLDPTQPISDVMPLDAVVRQPLEIRTFLTWLLTAFGALALLLAGLGVYGMLSYAVSQRTQEIGIRMALGAERGDVLTSVIQRGVALALAGVASGVAGSFALTGYLQSQLFGVGPRDPVIFTLVPVTLLAFAAAASYIPARRATVVDPIIALRYE
jgi:putative ABC transport system permease protein